MGEGGICLNASTFFTPRLTVVSWDEGGDGALDNLLSCVMDAAIKTVLHRLEAEEDVP